MHFTITKLVREIEGKLILTYRRAAPESDGTLILSAGRAYSFVFFEPFERRFRHNLLTRGEAALHNGREHFRQKSAKTVKKG